MSADYYNNAAIVDDDLVVTQILSRLPSKSLTRFKCVCKVWKSIIEQDSNFVDLHHTRSQARPVLLIAADPKRGGKRNWQNCFYSADLQYDDDGDNVIGADLRTTVRKLNTPSGFQRQLGPVRGLFCLFEFESYSVQIYNVCTGQVITPWIKSTVARNPYIYFGFDPQTGKHKVVYVTHSIDYKAPIYKVLTVGDNRWRIIDDAPPPCQIDGQASTVYANGSVYWTANAGRNLVAFDFGPEKFRTIPIPET